MVELVIDWYTKNQPDKWQLIIAKFIENMGRKDAIQYDNTDNFINDIGFPTHARIFLIDRIHHTSSYHCISYNMIYNIINNICER